MTDRRLRCRPRGRARPWPRPIARWSRPVGRLTARLIRAIGRLKAHQNPWVRRGLGCALILGGLLAFLPVLGIWMLPLGLVILSDERHALRRPRRRLQVWAGQRWPACRVPAPAEP
jgi:hypothetical protein